MTQSEAYALAQERAKSDGKPCWEYFECPHGADLRLGVVCKGNCEEAMKNKEKQYEAKSM